MVLRLEGLVVLVGAVVGYARLGGDWWLFAGLFLASDLSMLGYLVNRSVGATCYNCGHSTLGPGLLAGAGFAADAPLLYILALIWLAHIGFDRVLGYGLKYSSGFGVTHLGLGGRRR